MGSDPTVTFRPWDIEIEVPTGTTLLDAAERGDVRIEALCGGNGLCGTCAVQVEEDDPPLSPVDADERTVLAEAELAEGYRLGCQATVQGDLSVFVPASSRSEGEIVMTEGAEIDFEHDPAIRRYQLAVPAPTLEEDRKSVV